MLGNAPLWKSRLIKQADGKELIMSISKPGNFLLYSTVTEMAYNIGRRYYGDVHFVWCTDSFDSQLQPGTSNPRKLCNDYIDQIRTKDRHAIYIENNKKGILRGAQAKLAQGIIDTREYDEIVRKIDVSDFEEYYPVIFLINKRAVKNRIQIVSPDDAASDHSVEYKIVDLKSQEFERIHLRKLQDYSFI